MQNSQGKSFEMRKVDKSNMGIEKSCLDVLVSVKHLFSYIIKLNLLLILVLIYVIQAFFLVY